MPFAPNVYVPGQQQNAASQPYQPQQQATASYTSPPILRIYVTVSANSQKETLDLEANETIGSIKELLEEEIGIAYHEQEMKWNGKTLENHQTLVEVGVSNGGEISVTNSASNILNTSTTRPLPSYYTSSTTSPPNMASNTSGNSPAQSSTATNNHQSFFAGDDEASFKKEFDKLDPNHDGYITQQELSKLCLGLIKPSKMKKIFKLVDKNNDNKIDFQEYVTIRKQIAKLGIPGLGGKKK